MHTPHDHPDRRPHSATTQEALAQTARSKKSEHFGSESTNLDHGRAASSTSTSDQEHDDHHGDSGRHGNRRQGAFAILHLLGDLTLEPT